MADSNGPPPFIGQYGGNIPSASTGLFISDKVVEALDAAQFLVVMPLLFSWSLVVGCINILAFIKMGVREGINQNFLILSIIDFLLNVNQASSHCVMFLLFTGYESNRLIIPLRDINDVIKIPLSFLKTCSVVTFTAIAIVRCCFVTFPLRAPAVLTARRQLYVILVLFGASAIFYIPAYASMRLVKVNNVFTNTTIVVFMRLPQHIDDYMRTFQISSFFVVLTLILIGLATLINSLRRSSRFRESMPNFNPGANRNETRAIKCVIFVAVLFLICNSPFILFSFLTMFVPSFNFVGPMQNEAKVLGMLILVFAQLDVACNFFGYFKFNQKFRATVRKMCCPCIKSNRDQNTSRSGNTAGVRNSQTGTSRIANNG